MADRSMLVVLPFENFTAGNRRTSAMQQGTGPHQGSERQRFGGTSSAHDLQAALDAPEPWCRARGRLDH